MIQCRQNFEICYSLFSQALGHLVTFKNAFDTRAKSKEGTSGRFVSISHIGFQHQNDTFCQHKRWPVKDWIMSLWELVLSFSGCETDLSDLWTHFGQDVTANGSCPGTIPCKACCRASKPMFLSKPSAIWPWAGRAKEWGLTGLSYTISVCLKTWYIPMYTPIHGQFCLKDDQGWW